MENLFRQKIVECKTQSEWKFQLTMKIKLISSKKDSGETCDISKKHRSYDG